MNSVNHSTMSDDSFMTTHNHSHSQPVSHRFSTLINILLISSIFSSLLYQSERKYPLRLKLKGKIDELQSPGVVTTRATSKRLKMSPGPGAEDTSSMDVQLTAK